MTSDLASDPDLAVVGSRGLLAPAAWGRLRFIVDTVVLYVAAAVALLTGRSRYTTGELLLAAVFPLIALVVLRGHRASSERLKTTFVDVVATVIGAVSLTAMVTLAAGSVIGVGHTLDLVLRVWVYCALYLSLTRYTLVLVRRRAAALDNYATPVLIIGAE